MPRLMDETVVVRALRAAFRRWPYLHGRAWLLRLARLLLGANVGVWSLLAAAVP